MSTKKLKFCEPLPNLILLGKKNTTWRIDDDKQIKEGDSLCLCKTNGDEFANAKVVLTKETKFENLCDEDWDGHEKFSSDEKMYETYSKYYGKTINPKTKVKIIKFEIF